MIPFVTAPSIPAMAQASAARYGSAPALVDGDVTLSFEDVARQMTTVARALVARGVRPGDRVAIWAPNCATYVPAALGIQACGAWLVPLNSRLKGEEAAFALERVGASVLLTVDGFLGIDYRAELRAAAPDLPVVADMVEMPGPATATVPEWDEFLASGAAVDPAEVQARIDALGPDDVCDIIMTSGTTGRPKGVMLRHGPSLRVYPTAYNDGYRLHEGEKQLVITPFFHCFGYKAGWMLGLMVGAVTYPLAVFDALEAMKIISSAGISHMPGSPTMFTAILDHPDRSRYDLSSLRSSMLSAATVPREVVDRVRDDLGVDSTLTGYGLTENHAFVSVTTPEDPTEVVCTTAGRIVDGVDARVVDAEGNDVEPGQPGELLLRGFLVMSGYYDDPEATAETIVDGWLHTGDVVVMTPDRYVTITDRLKDLYIIGGFNVAPADVERTLLGMPGIAQVAVVGMPDERMGEVGAAFVIPHAGADVTPDAVIAYAREHMANYKVPRRVEIVDALPLNATGKVLKHVLRDRLTA